ncbi:isoprenylcysteine carboxylmethyltransferase family protein [Devosia rhodophyticola]|uniref:Isoprenylcysteine carboxylmethyltransferase family protein n=1 Tax=Devosia rhodophyticola TaxID=3026423 RepID=A0ABY7Z1Z9_9HYPH|nr:isoprenylcysteine carboxylmethyltransferase family protein [Devosia rhodophyticola]WDR07489.1 isoprenylcysteine carboxylmethyltransferase family protein [Devosia rhodophyticola]
MGNASIGAVLLLALVIGQRLVELQIAKRNTKALLARGGREFGAEHYWLIVALHTAWIAALVWFGWQQQLVWAWVGVYLILQVARVWILRSLGGRWTTRIVIVEEPAIRRGPYRFVRHPNYWLVAAELITVPMALGLPWVAVLFAALNAAMMWVRIGAENKALAGLPKA